jgi:PhnB protein
VKTNKVKSIPEGFHTITPYITVKDANRAIEFYTQAFGAKEIMRLSGPDGQSVMHAELEIGGSRLLLGDERPEGPSRSPESMGGTTVTLILYVKDVDAAFERAVSAGAEVRMPVADMFWGDRSGSLTDPFGYPWMLATHKEDLTPEQVRERAGAFFSQEAKK